MHSSDQLEQINVLMSALVADCGYCPADLRTR